MIKKKTKIENEPEASSLFMRKMQGAEVKGNKSIKYGTAKEKKKKKEKL